MDEALETVETDSHQGKKMGEKEDMAGLDKTGEIPSQDKTGEIEDQTDIDPTSAVTSREDSKERIADAPDEDFVDAGKTRTSDKGMIQLDVLAGYPLRGIISVSDLF